MDRQGVREMVKTGWLLLGLGAIVLILVEYLLRWGFGLGRPLLYVPDEAIGYYLAPNQVTRRFGQHIAINQFGQRSDPISADRPPQTLRLMLLGDSLVNGGWWTDQAATLSAMVQRDLEQVYHQDPSPTHLSSLLTPLLPAPPDQPWQTIQVLNVAANSWGPRNQLAYLERFGCFQSQALVLIMNTDDFFGTQPRPEVVGRDLNYADHYPPSALVELWTRSPLAKRWHPSPPSPPPENDLVSTNLQALQAIHRYSHDQACPLALVLSPLKRELALDGGPRPYEIEARARLQAWVESAGIPYLDLLPQFNATPDPHGLYRDHIHLSDRGTRLVSQLITRGI